MLRADSDPTVGFEIADRSDPVAELRELFEIFTVTESTLIESDCVSV